MSQRSARAADVPDGHMGLLRICSDVIQPLLDVKGCARLLGVSPDMVERLRAKADLPAVDLGFQRPGRRHKHLWRFNPVEVRDWWIRRGQEQRKARAGGSGGGGS